MTTAFVFPGQGSQVVGMGRDLYTASLAAQLLFDLANATLGFSLSKLCFEGPEEQLMATENAQPALLTTSMALLATLANGADLVEYTAQHAAFVAGHSLGEYSALVAAGVLPFVEALRLVRRRGELMAAARDGAMAAVLGADEAVLEEICREVSSATEQVVVANYNAPGQLVISGTMAAVEQAGILAKQRGAKRSIPLKVSAAFHSPLMQAAADGLQPALLAAPFAAANLPVLANVTAEPLTSAEALRSEVTTQVTAPVRWIASVQQMAAAGVDTFIEIGPGAVLTGLIKRIAPTARLINLPDLAAILAYRASIS